MGRQESGRMNGGGNVTAADLMELQEAASRLRSQCVQKTKENIRMNDLLLECNRGLFFLHAKELLLLKEVLLWSTFYHRFVQPLYDYRLSLGRYCTEAQHMAIQEMILREERKSLLAKTTTKNRTRENSSLLTQVRKLQEERDVLKEQLAAAEVRLKNALEEGRGTRNQVALLRDDLALCMSRLEESERERTRVERHLSQHKEALAKRVHSTLGNTCYEEEIRSRDDLIAKLQLTIRDLNALVVRGVSSRLGDVNDTEVADEKQRSGPPLQEIVAPITPLRVRGDSCSSARLQNSIQLLRMQLGVDVDSPTDRPSLFPHCSTPSSPLMRLPPSSLSVPTQASASADKISADLQKFLLQELQAPCS